MKRDILYVDDEMDNSIVFEAAFEEEFNVLCVRSGQEALEVLERVPVPVVVSDQRMPEMTGVELFQVMRRRHPHIQRIILTGYTDPDAIVAAINRGGIFQFIQKPWQHASLRTIILRAIEAHDLAVANTALTDQLVTSERCALLGRAAARIAHEMSNQLSMFPLLDYLESEYPGHPKLLEMAGFARKTYERLADLVREVKTFIRFEHEEFSRLPLPLTETVRELAAFLRFDRTIPHSQVEIQLGDDSVVLGNRVKIQQVLTNLIRNAADSVRDQPDGVIRVSVDQEGEDAIVRVADNGCGIPPEILERIWDPYFTTKGARGNGLGLDICRRLIDSHDGTITCESELGAGAVFTIRLPALARGGHAPDDVLAAPDPSPARAEAVCP